jgi:hypothetical protein
MPGRRLDATETPVPKFAVAGKYGRPDQDQFVNHVAILSDDCELSFGRVAEVWHCSPPIIAGRRTAAANEQADSSETHAVSFVEDLSPGEVAGIQTTLDEIDAQTQLVTTRAGYLSHYVVHPPVVWVRDRVTGRRRFRKFSCVGFVLECYEEGAGIRLLDCDSTAFPMVDLETLASAYNDDVCNARLRERFGVVGPEPWPIALAGYVMHSLNRSADDVRKGPHLPVSLKEASFPLETITLSQSAKDENGG